MRADVELSLIDKHVRNHHEKVGEYIHWHEFLPMTDGASGPDVSEWDDIFNEGSGDADGGRSYASPKIIPVTYVLETEDEARAIDDGRQPFMKLHAVMLFQDVVEAGLSSPHEYQPHLNDIVYYDERWYKLRGYRVRGRLKGDVLLTIDAYEVYIDQEFVWDPGPTLAAQEDYPWPSTFPS